MQLPKVSKMSPTLSVESEEKRAVLFNETIDKILNGTDSTLSLTEMIEVATLYLNLNNAYDPLGTYGPVRVYNEHKLRGGKLCLYICRLPAEYLWTIQDWMHQHFFYLGDAGPLGVPLDDPSRRPYGLSEKEWAERIANEGGGVLSLGEMWTTVRNSAEAGSWAIQRYIKNPQREVGRTVLHWAKSFSPENITRAREREAVDVQARAAWRKAARG